MSRRSSSFDGFLLRMAAFMAVVSIFIMTPLGALAAAAVAVAAGPVADAAHKFLDFSTLNLQTVGLGSIGVYAAIEGWVAHRLDGTKFEGMKRYVPAAFSFLTWLAGGLASGASMGTIGVGALSTALGSMVVHDTLGNLGGVAAGTVGTVIKAVQSAGAAGPISTDTLAAYRAKGDRRFFDYHDDGSPIIK